MAFKAKIILKGQKNLIRQLKKRTGEAFERAKRVQNETSRDILQESQSAVPKDTYELARSARIEDVTEGRQIRTLAINYHADHAYAVHEDMNAKHKSGEEAKYLEKPAKKQRRRYAVELRQAVRGGLE